MLLESLTCDIELLYQNDDLLLVNKPSGLHVHPTPEARGERVFVTTLLQKKWGLSFHPIHRLDRPTSGVLLFAKSSQAAAQLQQQLQLPSTQKTYWALARGNFPAEGVWQRPLKDLDTGEERECLSSFKLLEQFSRPLPCALIEVQLHSGRRHQIRRHAAGDAHHLIGDTTYGKGGINRTFRQQFDLQRLFLHAQRLSFEWQGQRLDVSAPLPGELHSVLEGLRHTVTA